MISKRLVFFLCLLSLFILMSDVSAKRNICNKSKKIKLNNYFNTLQVDENFNGTVLAAKKGKILFLKGLGMADFDNSISNSGKTIFAISSMTKAFTAASIMMLNEHGLIDLNDTIDQYVPELLNGDKITIKQLLSQTSGIPEMLNVPELWGRPTELHSPQELLAYFQDLELNFEPGTQFEYSNSNYIVLGVVIEKITGLAYQDFLKKNIFKPLKMRNTFYQGAKTRQLKKLAIGYDDISVSPPLISMDFSSSIAYAAGGIYSDVIDLYKWDQALYTEKIISQESIEAMFTPVHYKYGYGWYIDKLDINGNQYEHVWHWGAYFGFHSYISRIVDEKITIILLRNTSPVLGTEDELRSIIADVANILLTD